MSSTETTPLPRSRIVATLRALVHTRVTTGLLVVLPIYVTFIVVKFVFDLMRGSSQWIVEAYLRSKAGEPLLNTMRIDLAAATAKLGHEPTPDEFMLLLPLMVRWGVAIFSVALTIFLLYAIGLFAANVFGKRMLATMDRLFHQLPLIKTVYSSMKQILATFTGEQAQFKTAALVPFPTPEMRAVGFVTNALRDPANGRELVAVFIPTTPNPTTGFFQVLPRENITPLPWSAEETVRTIMSGGILLGAGVTFKQTGLPSMETLATSNPSE